MTMRPFLMLIRAAIWIAFIVPIAIALLAKREHVAALLAVAFLGTLANVATDPGDAHQ